MGTDRRALSAHLDAGVEREVLDDLAASLSDGLQIHRWWRKADAADHYADKYALMRQPDGPGANFGFYDQVPLTRGLLPVAGVVQDMFYDRPKARKGSEKRAALWMRDQVRAFVLRHFLRICSRRARQIYAPAGTDRDQTPQRTGFGYRQFLYKEKATGCHGRFPPEERYRMIDLSEIGTRYEWVLGNVQIFDFGLTMKVGGFGGLELYIPVHEDVYVVFHEDLCVHRDDPSPGVLGEYGYGYTFIANPRLDGIWAYGPEKLVSAFEMIHFRVLDSGEVWVKMAFCANLPQRILVRESSVARLLLQAADRVTAGAASRLGDPLLRAYDRSAFSAFQPDPTFLSIDLANLATLGLAGSELAITRRRLITNIMGAHFLMLYDFILQTLPAFKRVSDWGDEGALPGWVTHPEPFSAP